MRKWMSRAKFLALVAAVHTGVARGEMIVVEPLDEGSPSKQTQGPYYFDATAAGLITYGNWMAAASPQEYEQLRPSLAEIAEREDQAILTSATLGFVGLTTIVGSFTFFRVEEAQAVGRPLHRTDGTVLATGVGILGLAFVLYHALSPGRLDVIDVVNRNNAIPTAAPLRIEF